MTHSLKEIMGKLSSRGVKDEKAPIIRRGDGAPGREQQDQRPGGREELAVDPGPQGSYTGGRRPARGNWHSIHFKAGKCKISA